MAWLYIVLKANLPVQSLQESIARQEQENNFIIPITVPTGGISLRIPSSITPSIANSA